MTINLTTERAWLAISERLGEKSILSSSDPRRIKLSQECTKKLIALGKVFREETGEIELDDDTQVGPEGLKALNELLDWIEKVFNNS